MGDPDRGGPEKKIAGNIIFELPVGWKTLLCKPFLKIPTFIFLAHWDAIGHYGGFWRENYILAGTLE
jgi:hypothetical protein